MIKLTQDFVEKQFKNSGYVLLGVYTDGQTPMLCEKNGYKAYINYANFSIGRSPSFFRLDNPFVEENMRLYIKRVDSSVKVLKIKRIVNGNRKRILLTLQCSCGNVYTKLWDDIYNRNSRLICQKCSLKIRGKNHRKNKQEFINKFIEAGYKFLEDIDDVTRNDYIKVENKDGYVGYISYNRLLQNRKIAIFDIRSNKENYIYNVNRYCELNGIKSRAIRFSDNQKWTKIGIQFQCECGNYFETSIASFQTGKIVCDNCSRKISRYETIVKNFLEDNHIPYIYQYVINSCRDVLPLPFDFLVNNKLIEIDGEGHFNPVCFHYDTMYKNETRFDYTKRHDMIKDEYCKKFNIPLLRISYLEIKDDSYKNKIIQFIKE